MENDRMRLLANVGSQTPIAGRASTTIKPSAIATNLAITKPVGKTTLRSDAASKKSLHEGRIIVSFRPLSLQPLCAPGQSPATSLRGCSLRFNQLSQENFMDVRATTR